MSITSSTFSIATVALLLSTAATAQECEPSRWGADDQLGSANHVTPESVLAALDLVKLGQTHPLGIVIPPGIPAYPPRSMALQIVQTGQQWGRSLEQDYGWPLVFNDDLAQLWWGMGSQIDGLGHFGVEQMFYNCNDGKDIGNLTGLTRLGIHNVPPLVGRGVLIDMAGHFGVEHLGSGQAFTAADIREAIAAQEVEIREGDVILFHTGWTDAKLATEPEAWFATQPGLSNDAATYVASLDPMAVGADNWGIDVIPPVEGEKVFFGHGVFLKENGIYLLEVMNTGRLAAENVKEFLFVLGQARVEGAVQMMINPVALW